MIEIFFKKLDFLSMEPRLYTHGKSRYVNNFGISMSISSLIVILVFSFYFVISFFKGKGLNIVYYNVYDQVNVIETLNYRNFFFNIEPGIIDVVPVLFFNNNTHASRKILETEPCSMMS